MLKVNRVVTALDADGKSIIWRSGAHDNCFVAPGIGTEILDLWQTDGASRTADASEDTGTRPIMLEPPRGGSVFRIVEMPPDETWINNHALVRELVKNLGSPDAVGDADADPRMHVTPTTDYVIVLKGELWAVMEEGEALLRQGDVLIQQCTWHAWHNRSRAPCTIACVLMSNQR